MSESAESSFVDEREDVQKKTFAKWINSQLVKNGKPLVQDVVEELRDGEALLSLLEILTAQQYKRERGRMRVHHINNVNTALQVLQHNDVKLVNISANDIVDANPKLVLGLVWSIIVHWQGHGAHTHTLTHSQLERTLRAWCVAQTQNYSGVEITNFTRSWSDGLAFNALLHRWRPQLFDYSDVIAMPPSERLNHAFSIAHKHLGIEPLLDPEDVNTPNPDKKSILMYVMCLYQSMPHAGHDVTNNSEQGSPPTAERANTRPVSACTLGELATYGAALEEALAWLLACEETLAHAPDPPEPGEGGHCDLQQLKDMFHQHESFLLELSGEQARVGGVLEEGGRLLGEGGLDHDECQEVRLQMRLVSRRWEALRVRALSRQQRVHSALMRAQEHNMRSLREWLTQAEERIATLAAKSGRARAAGVQSLHAELARLQPAVDALAHCVVVVDEMHDTDVTEIEDSLTALGERWAHTCEWTLKELRELGEEEEEKSADDEAYERVRDQLAELEKELKEMEANPVTAVGDVMSRMSRLRVAVTSLREASRDAGAVRDARGEALQDRGDALQCIAAVQCARIRELGFEFDLSTSPPPTPTPTPTTATTPTTSPSGNKKPRLASQAAELNQWADDALKSLLECEQQLCESGGVVGSALERVERELDTAQPPEDTDEDLKRKIEKVRQSALNIRNTQNLLQDKHNYCTSLNTLETELDDISSWKKKTENDHASTNLLIHVRNKLRALRQIHNKLQTLNTQANLLLSRPLPQPHKDHIDENSKRVNELSQKLTTDLNKRETDIKQTINKPVKKQNDFETIENAIKDIEIKIMGEHAMISSKIEMEKKIEDLMGLKKELEEMQSEYDRVVKEKRAQYEKGSVPDLRSSLESLVTRYSDSSALLEQKINKLKQGITLLDEVSTLRNDLSVWLDEVEGFSQENCDVTAGDQAQLALLLTASNKYEDDKPTYKSKLDTLEEKLSAILEDASESLSKSLPSELKGVSERFKRASETALQVNEKLRRASEKTDDVFNRIQETEEFLQEIEREMPPALPHGIADAAALYAMKGRFHALRTRCDARTPAFRELNELSNDMLLAASNSPRGADGTRELARRVLELNAHWTKLTASVYQRYKVLSEAWLETGELRAWLTQEEAWQAGLQRRLTPVAVPKDAEELCDQLYDLENYVRSHDAARLERIQHSAAQLVRADIMPGWSRRQAATLSSSLHALQAQAASRISELEAAARMATRGELALHELEQWLTDVASGGQDIAEELEEKRSVLAEVECQIESYSADGNTEAADRLREKLEPLKRKFTALSSSNPAGVEPERRLLTATGTLRRVACEAAELRVRGDKPELVRAQLTQCIKFYRTLSEIKSEVETIIKSGRKMVEEKSVADPQDFSKKIDTLKELYNKLGAQITESKTKLENALLTAREIQNDLQSLTAWLDGLGNVGKQTLELEMSRMEAIKDKLNANYAEFSNNCEEEYAANLREQIDGVNQRWELLRGGVSEPAGLQKQLASLAHELGAARLGAARLGAARLGTIGQELRLREPAARALGLHAQWEDVHKQLDAASQQLVEYENVTDTIKRRLDSPLGTPEPDRPELKKSKIPLAVKSPIPIRKEVLEGRRSRGSSVEREKRKGSPMSDSIHSNMSNDSIEISKSVPSTPETNKDSSTFNLLKDSELFTQISKNKVVPGPPARPPRVRDPCRMVEVTSHEVVRGTVTTADPIESVVEFIPQTAETVDIIDDSESIASDDDRRRPSVELGMEPHTFVVEVKTLEHRMKPTLGILKRKNASDDEKTKVMKVSLEVPDVVSSSKPSVPSPILHDLAVRQQETNKSLLRDEVNEYLILDEVPKDQAALPEPSHTQETFHHAQVKEEKQEIKEVIMEPEQEMTEKSGEEEEVIYSEVEEMSQSVSGAVLDSPPLGTSTPLKQEVHVVAMSPKHTPASLDDSPSTLDDTPSPLDDTPIPSDEIPADIYQCSDDYQQENGEDLEGLGSLASDPEVRALQRDARAVSRRMDVMLLTLACVDKERDPAKRREIIKQQVCAVAPMAAGVLSRGESLVAARLRASPLLAACAQDVLLEPLRAQWGQLMRCADHNREKANQAEENVKEVTELLETVQQWLKSHEGDANSKIDDKEMLDMEDKVERMEQLSSELRALRIQHPERAAGEAARYVRRLRTQDPLGGEWVTLANKTRACISAQRAALRAPPLGGALYDSFPMQEDCLLKIKSAIADLRQTIEEREKEFIRAQNKSEKGVGKSAQAVRVRQKMQEEWSALLVAYDERYDKWSECQSVWARLYASLETLGGWMDVAEGRLRDAAPEHKHSVAKQIQQELAGQHVSLSVARACGQRVLTACCPPLCGAVLQQLQQLARRRLALLTHCASIPTPATPSWSSSAEELLRRAGSLLDKPAHETDVNAVQSLEEEVSSKLREMEVLRKSRRLPVEGSIQLQADLQKTQAALSGRRVPPALALAVSRVRELRGRVQAARDLPPHARDSELDHVAATAKEHEAEINDVIENINNDPKQSASVLESVTQLKEDWALVRALSDAAVPHTISNDTPTKETSTTPPTKDVSGRKSSVDSQSSDWSARLSGRRRSSQQSPAALLAHFDTSALQIRDWVTVELDMLRAQTVNVGDVDQILNQLDKQKGVLRELEQKKPQLDELLHTAESLKGTENRQQLHGKVTALREHWDEANARVLQRKAQLDAMLGDSQRYEGRRRDADAWLGRMETRLARMTPPGHTADVLEMQMKEQKSFHAEVHQYKHQIELFGQLTQRLIAVYRNDDTTRIKRATEAINHRYNELNNSIVARGKALHSAVSSLQNFDRSLEKFVAWLSEAESLLDAAERDPHLLKVFY